MDEWNRSTMNVKLNVRVFLDTGVLIDTGCTSMQRQFTEWMNDKEINTVFLTHSHEDHVGACKWLQEVKHTPIYLHEDSLLPVSQKASYPYYRKVFWGVREPFSARPMFDEIQVNNSKWLSIHTPGHSSDHYSFFNQSSGNLYSGDLFVHPTTKVILKEESIPQIIQSLNKLLSIDFENLFCQHAGFVPNGKEKLNKKLQNLLTIQGEVLLLNEKGYSEKEIVKKLYPKNYPISYFSFGE